MCSWPGKRTGAPQHQLWGLSQDTLTLLQGHSQAPQPMEKQGKLLSYQKLGCCDLENPKSVCWDGPGGMQEGNSQGMPLLTRLIPRNRDPHRLCRWVADMGNTAFISSECCVKLQKVVSEGTGKGREKNRRNRG